MLKILVSAQMGLLLAKVGLLALFGLSAQQALAEESAFAPELSLSMVTATSIKGELPFVLFSGGKFQPDSTAEFVKLHMHFDEPSTITRIEVDSCTTFKSHVLFYFNFDERMAWSDANGEKTAWAETKDDAPFRVFKPGEMKVSSITVNFRDNSPLCLAGVKIYNGKQKYQVKVPRVVAGSMTANSTLAPVESYDVMNLFDSRYEYAWSSDSKLDGAVLEAKFEKPETITKLRIWNGYQRTSSHCYSNGRLKELKLEGEGYSETVKVADQMGSQVIDLPKPFKGKSLKLSSVSGYAGKKYQDLVVSELRFFDGKEWFLISPLGRAQEIAKRNRDAFALAGLEAMVNRNFRSVEAVTGSPDDAAASRENWTFRFREDGSFFAKGSHWSEEGATGATYSALGNYEVKSKGPSGIELRLFGSLRKVKIDEGDLDCNGCGRNCNSKADEAKEGRIFQDFVTLKKGKENRAAISNTSKGPKILSFKPHELEPFSGDEYSE